MWKCAYCDHEESKRPRRTCPKCGLVLAGLGTDQKYKILKKYCRPLSLIMRNQEFEHYFIDACAGSGVVQELNSTSLIDGSPLIMAKTGEWVENQIRDKEKEPSVKCIFIEDNQKTFEILKESVSPYSDLVECLEGDSNVLLDKVLDRFSNVTPVPFALVYIDPFGLGTPPIQHDTIKRVMQRPFTELFIHFPWEAVSRMAGHLKNIDDSNLRKRKIARSNVDSLNVYMGGDDWQSIEEKNLPSHKRRREYVQLYENMLRKWYSNILHIQIPVGESNPSYYLFFTTRNETGKKIMKDVMSNMQRRGARPLDEFI